MNEHSKNRVERERILLKKIEERDHKILRQERKLMKVLYIGYFTGAIVGLLCGIFLF